MKEPVTAKDFWNKACSIDDGKSPSDIMIEFTKIHVERALKNANKNGRVLRNDGEKAITFGASGYSYSVDSHSITNAYPLKNIK